MLLTWLARQPEAKLDGRRDPRVGMHGGSYAGEIQFVAAGIDRRIDAIAPSVAWHSLVTSLPRPETIAVVLRRPRYLLDGRGHRRAPREPARGVGAITVSAARISLPTVAS